MKLLVHTFGIRVELAFVAAVPVKLVIILGTYVVSEIISIGSYLAQVFFRKLGAA
jgi:hypothetical protein